MTVFDRLADRALALAASGACDDDAVHELVALTEDDQLAPDVARSLVWLRPGPDPACRRRADDLLTTTIVQRPRGAARRPRPAPPPRRRRQAAPPAAGAGVAALRDAATTGSLRVRHAVSSDAGAITSIHLRAWHAALRGRLPAEVLDRQTVQDWTTHRRALLGASPVDGHTWVAVARGQVVGFARAARSRDPDLGEDTAQVHELSVDPELTGSGVEQSLLAAVGRALALRRLRRAAMWVGEGDDGLRRACQAAGWWADGGSRLRQQAGVAMVELRYRRDLAARRQ